MGKYLVQNVSVVKDSQIGLETGTNRQMLAQDLQIPAVVKILLEAAR